MPQIFQVLCCYSCEMFQVHQVKKSNKWQCRVCNEKQSLKKAFKIGPSRDCRLFVQKLNMQKSGHVEENEDTDACESNNDWSECENIASELHDYTEKKSLSCSFVEDNETSDHSLRLEEANTSCYSEFASQLYEEDNTADEIDFLSQNSKVDEISQCTSDCDDKLLQKVENDNQYKLPVYGRVIERKVSKHPLETQINSLSHDAATLPPPFKKNRGFQIIMNAASKLN